MPIPTDTFWNVKKLNLVFAISALALVGVTVGSILQDYGLLESGTDWRTKQRAARTWDAALTVDKIDATTTPEKQQQLKQLDEQIAAAQKDLDAHRDRIDKINAQIRQMVSERSTMELRLNKLKSNVGVDESHLQDAIAADDRATIDSLNKKLAVDRPKLTKDSEDLTHKTEAIAAARLELKQETARLDALVKRKNALTGDADALRKKLATVQPQNIFAKVSAEVRAAPLMGFINPSEKLQQVVLPDVLTDVAFMRIATVDRCTSCHVNIAKKDFTEANVLAYLEEQSAAAKQLKLPATFSGVPTDPFATQAKPGALGMIEFWHGWARKLAPAAVKTAAAKLRTVVGTVGKSAAVNFDGHTLAAFAYDPTLDDPRTKPSTQPSTQPTLSADDQSRVLVELLDAWLKYPLPPQPNQSITHTSADGRIQVTIANVDEKTAKPIRNAAMRYPEELRTTLRTALDKDQQRLLNDRYRYAMVDFVNVYRKKEGRPALDPSAALLAHPRLDLYCDPDSKHPMESAEGKIGMGCTSCHDGSGQETNFVLVAHSPRDIFVDSKTGEPVLKAQLAHDPEADHHEFKLDNMLAAVYPEHALTPTLASTHLQSPSAEPASAGGAPENKEAHDEEPAPIDYINPVTGEHRKAVTQFTFWRNKYEPEAPRDFALVYHEWDWPMRPPQYIQANCVRCHSDVNDIKDAAPVVAEGRYLFANLGCVNCHQMDSITTDVESKDESRKLEYSNGQRKVGPDLRHVTAKLSPAFINTWIWAPKSFRPSTKMPHFFMLENNSSDEEIRRTRQEARAITEYLVRTATPLPRAHEIPAGAKGSAAAGQQIFNSIGCKGCHVNLNDPLAEKRGNKQITLGEQWIVTDLVKNGKLKSELAEKNGGKDPDTKTLTDEARKLYDGMSYNERQLYVIENLEQLPGSPEHPTYPDNSKKPVFTHHGPELSGIGSKLTADRSVDEARAWLVDWVMEPRHYSDYTLMPRLRLNGQQALDVAEYLLSMKRPNDKPDDPWKADLTPVDSAKCQELTALQLKSRFTYADAFKKADDDAELAKLAVDALTSPTMPADQATQVVGSLSKDEKRLVFLGSKMIAHYGCMSCHAINGMEKATSPCANLSDWGQKQVDKLDYGYLSSHQPEIQPLPETSKIAMVNGLSDDAPSLAHGALDFTKPIAEPVTAVWPEVGHKREFWLAQKLKNTRIYDRGKALLEPTRKVEGGKDVVEDPGKPYDKLRMPTFYLGDDQVHAIVTFVLSNRDRLISEKLWKRADNDRAATIARGRELVTQYACVNCHPIEQNAPQVQQYYPQGEVTVVAPPSLRGEGNKIQHNWLFNFFKNVVQMRPKLFEGIRMPTFPATDQEWTAIIAYFNSVSQKESQDLKTVIAPVQKYIDDAKKARLASTSGVAEATPPLGASTKPTTSAVASATTKPLSPSDPWPGDDWWAQPTLATQAEYLRDWALSHELIAKLQLDPTKNKPDELGKSYRQVLFKAQFVQELFDAPFPFVDTPHPDIDEARFKKGEQLFYSMQCLACHVLGDSNIPGANKTPSAPNLSLAQQRLQRRWVRHWVQEPGIIQIGTAMPPFFTGLAIYDVHGQPWPRSQNDAPATVKVAEQMFGDTVDAQTNLVLDFLYAAGARGFTGVKPAKTPLEEAVAAQAPPKAPAKASSSKPTSSAVTPPSTASPAKNTSAGASTAPTKK